MIITDPVVTQFLTPSEFFIYIVEGGMAIGVIIAGKLWVRIDSQELLAHDLPVGDENSPNRK